MKKAVNWLVSILVITCSLLGSLFLFKGASLLNKVEIEDNENIKNNNKIDIEKVLSNYRKENVIFSEYENSDFVALITINEDLRHETIIIDNKSGEKIHFEDLIKEDKVDEFWDKVYELLDLKYPKFVIDGLKTSKGNIYYEIKQSEMIIYFEYFSFEVSLPETISIKVNYNEVKDYLNFTYKLDNEYLNESAYDYNKNKKAVAFSFDDGPNPKYTNKLVDILKENKAKATFFMLGKQMNNYKSNVLYVYENGLEIGSHTYGHINMKKNTIKKIEEELFNTNQIYNSITNSNIKLIRPPYGSYNSEILNNINYPFILWNIDTNDWRYHDKDYIVNHILSHVTDGSIILMHDSYSTTIEAVKEVLPKLYAMGYQVVTVSDLAALKGKVIQNNEVYSYFK